MEILLKWSLGISFWDHDNPCSPAARVFPPIEPHVDLDFTDKATVQAVNFGWNNENTLVEAKHCAVNVKI